ncbi:CaiB/BaiF CoA transferase family protein [Pigmentiphaga kullae]|uniref:Crotonobetainyl-CoA:carnitine CoA-transferase CaiB-like acyl-CoA transferase n=1 Tax=Pigmentiphaga kullae TaxID=151784 RepID=A0A4Q7NDA2_9BURK|nr:CaiB/BaiF CoA-transferase family protein [Pigmentiphaga kullae]RZS81031.1 crotonobetainyl-CoA:carnitine CoA-transferase CaiB-like acyl-CoA transferase [Pigmentiphaga kullae]
MALEHITVLDLTHMLSGPYGTMLLADLGARTIKVEPPGRGEGTRRLLENDPQHSRDGMGAYYVTLNRNKESVCVDLKLPAGREVFLDLVRRADVVFDNFSVGVTERLGIDHASLSKVNPRIVTCSVTGFGQTGPATQRPAFDQVVQAMGGGMSITGTPATGPIRSGIPIGDLGGGTFGAIGVLAALVEREQTGRGQHVDIAMLDVQISLLNYMATMYFMSGQIPEGIGNGHFVHVPYNCYPTADGHIIIACIGDAFFERFVEFIDVPELRRPEYRQQPVRFADKARIDEIISAELRRQPTSHWLARLEAARIPCGPVNDFAQALADPQVVARDMVAEVPLPDGTSLRMPGNPVKLSGAAPASFGTPPRLGEQTDAVLGGWLGYAPDRLAGLREQGVIG